MGVQGVKLDSQSAFVIFFLLRLPLSSSPQNHQDPWQRPSLWKNPARSHHRTNLIRLLRTHMEFFASTDSVLHPSAQMIIFL